MITLPMFYHMIRNLNLKGFIVVTVCTKVDKKKKLVRREEKTLNEHT